jgi:predicted HicB family RNase H-like nuclease
MTPHRYSADVRWSEEDGAFVAVCTEFGGLSALGPTAGAATQELEAAVALAVELYEEDGRAPPEPHVRTAYSGQFRVRLPHTLHEWLALQAQREGVSLNTLVLGCLAEAKGRSEAAPELVGRSA